VRFGSKGACVVIVAAALAAVAPAAASAETGTLEATGAMIDGHGIPTAAPLPNGDVLVAGGYDYEAVPDTQGHGVKLAEIYDPTTGTFSATGAMAERRERAMAAPLPNGDVLVAGGRTAGESFTTVKTAEIYDPTAGTFSSTGSMATTHQRGFAVSLPDGDVMVGAGGIETLAKGEAQLEILATTEIYDPATGEFSAGPELGTARWGAAAVSLPDGRILIAGGYGEVSPGVNGTLMTSEFLDPETGAVTPGPAIEGSSFMRAAPLPCGRAVFMGAGRNLQEYDPTTEAFVDTEIPAGEMAAAAMAPLPEGKVLIAGAASGGSFGPKDHQAWVYTPPPLEGECPPPPPTSPPASGSPEPTPGAGEPTSTGSGQTPGGGSTVGGTGKSEQTGHQAVKGVHASHKARKKHRHHRRHHHRRHGHGKPSQASHHRT
jgi:hypothetical protein